jgi:hypothetical protein
MKKISSQLPALLILALALLMVSCAPGNEKFDATPAGFWYGLWHGLISFVTFIISLFNDNVNIYEVNNTGKLYNLGFILGVMIIYGGGTKGGSSKWKRRE